MSGAQGLSDDQLLHRLNSSGASAAPASRPQGAPSQAASLSDGDLLSRLNMTPLEDMGRSAISGLERGAASIAGLHGDLSQFAGWSIGKIMGALGVDQQTAARIGQAAQASTAHGLSFSPLAPAMQAAGTEMSQGPVHNIGEAAQRAALATVQGASRFASDQPVSSAQIVAAHPAAQYQPHTRAGRYVQTAGEMAPAAVLPGSAGQMAARVAIPAVTAQSAAELAPEKYKGAAKMAGAVVGGGVEGLGEHLLESPYQTLARAAPNLTDEQIQQTQALRTAARARGIDLTPAEAVQQVTNGATSLGRVQRLVESTNRTAPQMAGYFAHRPDQIRNAVEGYASGIAPQMPEPGVLAMNAQRGAQGGLDFVRRSINDAAEPYYSALPGQSVDPATLQFADRPDATAALVDALRDVRSNHILNAKVSGLPDNDLAVLNEVAKRLDRNGDAYAQTAMNPGGDNSMAAAARTARSRIDELAEALSGDWRSARGTVAYGRQQFLDPLAAGPVGKIASTDDLAAQTGALYPRNPPVGAPAETARAVDVLNSQDGDLAAALTRQHLQNTFNQSTRELTGGPNQYGGAKFAADLLGNREQAATLHAGLGRLDQTGRLSGNLDTLADILQATGKRERPGSMTAFNAEDQKALSFAPGAVRFLGGLGDPLEWTKNLSNWTGGALGRRRLDILADLLTSDPEQTAEILRRARAAQPGSSITRLALPAASATEARP